MSGHLNAFVAEGEKLGELALIYPDFPDYADYYGEASISRKNTRTKSSNAKRKILPIILIFLFIAIYGILVFFKGPQHLSMPHANARDVVYSIGRLLFGKAGA